MSISSLKDYVAKGLFYEAVVEDGSDIIFITDYAGNILYHNPSVKDTLGYDPGSLTGRVFFDFIKPGTIDEFKGHFEISTKKPYNESVEVEFLCDDGTYRYLEFNSINLRQKSGVEGLILDCRDITQRKENARELLRARKAKEQFLANMSHEIRTPVNGISGMINLLSESQDSEEQQLYINAIKNSSESLRVLINDILDFSAIESGKLKFEQIGFSPEYQLSAVMDTFLYESKDKGIKLTYSIDNEAKKVFIGDPARLNQILINLVSNAIKFTHIGQISIRASVDRREGDLEYLKFEVADTGIGIPRDKINHIFDSFTQADTSVTRRYGGTGLGLTIVKELVELQHGKIAVESKENSGTRFTFTIPYEPGSDKDLVHPKSSKFKKNLSHNLKGVKVLLVEDNEVNKLYANSILSKWQCQISTAGNGLEAYEAVKNDDFDVVLMDVQMPILDGYGASRKIRRMADRRKATVPIIALTANAIKGDADKCLISGMNDYISKPFHPETLYRILTKYLSRDDDGFVLRSKEPAPVKDHGGLIDLSYLRTISNGDVAFMKNMVGIFMTNTPTIINEMQSMSDKSDWKMVSRAAHKLKPSLTFVGMHQAKPIISDLEQFGKEEIHVDQIPDKIDLLATLCGKAYLELESVSYPDGL